MAGARPVLLAVLVLAGGCCSEGDRGIGPPPGERLARSCVEAPDAARVTIAGREFCGLEEFAVEPVRGDYFDDVVDGFAFDAVGFAKEVDAAFAASRPRGWAWTLIQAHRPVESRVVASGSGGVAVMAGDAGAEVAFTTRTPSNIGSVTKLLAAIGLVGAYERVVAALPAERRYSLRRLLAVPVFELLPMRWQHRYATDNGLRGVTIGQLLLHTSRLVSDERDPDVDDNVEGLARNAADPDLGDNAIGYSNINYRLLFLVIGALLDPEGLRAIEEELADTCDDEFDDAYLRAAAVRTRDHLESLFAAVPGGMPATDCDPAMFGDEWRRKIAWAYRDGDDGDGAYYNSFTANPGYCSTTGGYYSSADDLAALLHAYHGGLIAPERRAILEGGSGMGWFVLGHAEVSFADPDLAATGIDSLLRKHGTQPIRGTDDVYHASVYKLPYGYYLAVTVNSGYADGSTTASRTYELVDAFAAAFSRE